MRSHFLAAIAALALARGAGAQSAVSIFLFPTSADLAATQLASRNADGSCLSAYIITYPYLNCFVTYGMYATSGYAFGANYAPGGGNVFAGSSAVRSYGGKYISTWQQLFDGSTISFAGTGLENYYWSGAQAASTGMDSANSCNSWSSTSNVLTGRLMHPYQSSSSPSWFAATVASCPSTYRVLCVCQATITAVSYTHLTLPTN